MSTAAVVTLNHESAGTSGSVLAEETEHLKAVAAIASAARDTGTRFTGLASVVDFAIANATLEKGAHLAPEERSPVVYAAVCVWRALVSAGAIPKRTRTGSTAFPEDLAAATTLVLATLRHKELAHAQVNAARGTPDEARALAAFNKATQARRIAVDNLTRFLEQPATEVRRVH